MVYEWGTKPLFEKEELADNDYDFPKGTLGKFVGLTHRIVCREDRILSVNNFAQQLYAHLWKKDIDILYWKIRKDTTFAYFGGPQHSFGFYYVTFTVEEAYFKSKGVIPFVALAIVFALLVFGIVVTTYILFPAVVYKLFGVTPEEAAKYNVAQIIPYVALIGVLLAVVLIIAAYRGKVGVKVGKK